MAIFKLRNKQFFDTILSTIDRHHRVNMFKVTIKTPDNNVTCRCFYVALFLLLTLNFGLLDRIKQKLNRCNFTSNFILRKEKYAE